MFKKRKPELIAEPQAILPPEILVEAKIAPTTCYVCGTVYQASVHHLKPDYITIVPIRNKTACPICGAYNKAEFIKPTEEQEDVT